MHNHQTEHKEQGNVVPQLFSGVLGMTLSKENEPLLHENHGKFGLNRILKFEHFAKNLLTQGLV